MIRHGVDGTAVGNGGLHHRPGRATRKNGISAPTGPGKRVYTLDHLLEKGPDMKLQLIRNATMKLGYAGQTLLTDPMLSPQGGHPLLGRYRPQPDRGVAFPGGGGPCRGGRPACLPHPHRPPGPNRPGRFCPSRSRCSASRETRRFWSRLDSGKSPRSMIPWPGEGSRSAGPAGRHGSGEILKRMGQVSGFVLRAGG